jgi:mercuric ion transport protein
MTTRKRFMPVAGALVSAIVASACCWLPLLLIVLGVSSVGIGVAFETLRPWFIGASVVLLGVGFYVFYFRREECAEGSACDTPHPGVRRSARIMLWVATVGVAAFIFLPGYIGALTRLGRAPAAGDVPIVITLQIDGMSCAGCAAGVEQALLGVTGVGSAEVSFEEERAIVSMEHAENPKLLDLIAAVTEAGYTATVASPDAGETLAD